jgi:hypothetical protein
MAACWIAHVEPFQISTRTFGPAAPTAVHAVGDGHDTPFSLLDDDPFGVGTGSIVQVVPFQLSASDSASPTPFVYQPTAVQADTCAQEMPVSLVAVAPVGAGVGWTFHDVPFQFSTRAILERELSVYEPTAMHDAAETHETAASFVFLPPSGTAGV